MTLLHAYIADSGQTRGDLAQALGISRSYLSELERGQKRPGLALAIQIEKLTGVPVTAWETDQ